MAYDNGDLVKISAVFTDIGGGEQVNAFHGVIETVGSGGDAGFRADVQDWIEDLYSDVQTYIHDTVVGNRIELYNVTDGTPDSAITFNPAWSGAGAGVSPLPTGVCGLVVARTGVSRASGRKYLPTFYVTAISGAHWSAGVMTAMNAFGSKWLDTFVGGNLWQIRGVVPIADGPLYRSIQSAAAELVPAYQRRRKEGRGS